MHQDRNNATWPKLKAKWHNKLDDAASEGMNVKRNNLDDETHDLQKVKKDRAAIQLSRVQSMLRDMADFNSKQNKRS